MASAESPRSRSTASGRPTRSGWKTGRPRRNAACFTGGGAGVWPRPRGRSGCVTTARTSWPASTTRSSVGTAKAGVPRKTSRMGPISFAFSITDIRTNRGEDPLVCGRRPRRPACVLQNGVAAVPAAGRGRAAQTRGSAPQALLPFARALLLLDFSLDEIAFERADVGDVEAPMQVLGLVDQSARQQVFAGDLKRFTLGVLGARRDQPATPYLLAEAGDGEAALFAHLLTCKEVATRLGLVEGTVKVYISKAADRAGLRGSAL